ncbi:MAG: hypothetical protein K0Q99_1320 [Clostridia bacterium]|jgi:uncharacterized membrane protein YbaN (DUF454 family)|nr:hypothetical protein [Clostridia bacterium]
MNRLQQILLTAFGFVFIGIGILGVFLPLLPTTPFLLLGASCSVKASPGLYSWLINNRLLGQYIKDFREGNGIPRKTKVTAILMLWTAIMYSIVFKVDNIYIRFCLLLIAACTTWHIASRKTLEQDGEESYSVESEEK